MESNRSFLEWVTAVAGAWTLLSVWILPWADPTLVLGGVAQVNHLLVGGAVVVLALAGVFAFRIWEEWILALLGLWLVASPWLLGFSNMGAFALSDVIVGLFVMATSGWVVFSENVTA